MPRRILPLATLFTLVLAGCPDGKKKPRPTKQPEKKAAPVQNTALPKKKETPQKKRPVRTAVPLDAIPKKGKPHDPFDHHHTPEFVTNGSGLRMEGGKKWFVGVGVAKKQPNHKLAHMLADQSADEQLVELLKKFEAEAAGAAAQKKGPAIAALRKEWIEKKAMIVDHWKDHDAKNWYSKKRIDALAYRAALAETLGVAPDTLPEL